MVELHWKFPSQGHIHCQLRDFRWISWPKLWRKLIRVPIRLFSASFSVYKSNGQSMGITGGVDGRIALKFPFSWAFARLWREFRWIYRYKLWRRLLRAPSHKFCTGFPVYKPNGLSMRMTGSVDGRLALKIPFSRAYTLPVAWFSFDFLTQTVVEVENGHRPLILNKFFSV